jgi:hypothetical protein
MYILSLLEQDYTMASEPVQLSPQRPADLLLPKSPKEVQILVINPNSNRDMTVGIGKLIEGQPYPPEVCYFL